MLVAPASDLLQKANNPGPLKAVIEIQDARSTESSVGHRYQRDVRLQHHTDSAYESPRSRELIPLEDASTKRQVEPSHGRRKRSRPVTWPSGSGDDDYEFLSM
jgi:hypothetical protein